MGQLRRIQSSRPREDLPSAEQARARCEAGQNTPREKDLGLTTRAPENTVNPRLPHAWSLQ